MPATPSPLNLFENARPAADGTLEIAAPVSTPGSTATFALELDAVLSSRPVRRISRRPTARPDRRPLPGARMSLRAVLVGGLAALIAVGIIGALATVGPVDLFDPVVVRGLAREFRRVPEITGVLRGLDRLLFPPR